MAIEPQAPTEPGMTSLLKGIVSDLGELIKKQFQFAGAELKADARKTWEASRMMAIGAGVATLGVIVLTFMFVYLLHALTAPPEMDPAGLPLWACHGIVGGVTLAIGATVLLAGKAKLESFNPLPDETLQTMKENLELSHGSSRPSAS